MYKATVYRRSSTVPFKVQIIDIGTLGGGYATPRDAVIELLGERNRYIEDVVRQQSEVKDALIQWLEGHPEPTETTSDRPASKNQG